MFNDLRSYFNIDNYSLAHYVGTSKSQIDSASVGRRSLQVDALLALDQLSQALEKDQPLNSLSTVQQYTSKEAEGRQELITQYSRKLVRLQEKLKQIEERRAKTLRGLHACANLLNKGELSPDQQQWLSLRQDHLTLRLQENAAGTVLRLKAEIAGIKAQLAFLEKTD